MVVIFWASLGFYLGSVLILRCYSLKLAVIEKKIIYKIKVNIM